MVSSLLLALAKIYQGSNIDLTPLDPFIERKGGDEGYKTDIIYFALVNKIHILWRDTL